MLIHTINFGDLEIQEEKIIFFKQGVPGFPQIHRFVKLDFEDLKPFQYLQAVDDPPIALLVVNPFSVDPGYAFELAKSDMEEIRTTDTNETSVYAVATIPDDPEQATVNLMAPIVVNERSKRAKQVILLDSGYSVKHPLVKNAESGARKSNDAMTAGKDGC
jgi:flagellar assembly factor FliW